MDIKIPDCPDCKKLMESIITNSTCNSFGCISCGKEFYKLPNSNKLMTEVEFKERSEEMNG
jgi:hypothetical protein